MGEIDIKKADNKPEVVISLPQGFLTIQQLDM